MAIAYVKNHGGATSKTSGTNLTVTLASAVPNGNLLVVTYGFDPLSTTTPTASALTGWTVVRTQISTLGTAGAGVAVWVIKSDGSSAFNSGATFTFSLSAATVARAIWCNEFSGADLPVYSVTGGNMSTSGYSPSTTATTTGDYVITTGATEENVTPTGTGGTAPNGGGTATTGGGSAGNIGVGLIYESRANTNASTGPALFGSDGAAVRFAIPQAAVGPQTFQVTGTVASSSTAAGSPKSYQGVTGAAPATSGTVGSPTSYQGVTGASAATSATVGAVAKVVPGAAGTVAAVSATAGTIEIAPTSTTYQVTGTVASVSGAAGAVALRGAGAGTSASTSSSSGAVSVRATLSGLSASTTTTAGSPTLVKVGLAGTVAAVSGLAGDVSIVTGPVTYPVVGTVASTSAAVGAVSSRLVLAGAAASVSSSSGDVSVITAPPSTNGYWGIRL